MPHDPERSIPPMPGDTLGELSVRRSGWSTVLQGVLFAVIGAAGLWLSFRFGDRARTILGAGPLIGGGMIGYGTVQLIFAERLPWIRWIVAVLTGLVVLGATIVLLESTLGVTFA